MSTQERLRRALVARDGIGLPTPVATTQLAEIKRIRAAEYADWTQIVLNGGPPCFHLEHDGRFCFRAERWDGHKNGLHHSFVSLADLLRGSGGIDDTSKT